MASEGSAARAHAEVVDLLTESLMPGHIDALQRLFGAQGAPEPRVVWSPNPSDMPSTLLRRFATACDTLAGDDGRVLASDFEVADLGAMADWTMLLVRENGGFRYDYYGAGIATHYGTDMTGRTIADFGGHISQFFAALYSAAASRHERVFSEHQPPMRVFVRAWRRLIVPLYEADRETVSAFAVANVPENELRTGLELLVDPVFVMDGRQVVHYANRAAAKMFGLDLVRPAGPTLHDLTGLDLTPSASPGDMLASGLVDDSVQLLLKGGIAERLVTTISAAEHRGTAFYVVVLRNVPA